ncbi:MAG: Thisulfide interchange protein [Candidatus Tokpelaia sp. JSC188]|nr:MAG: Thisulfide interchange protein [Candidatus Tokpelaia sp. JSC188]
MATRILPAGVDHFFKHQNLDPLMKLILLAATLLAVYPTIRTISTFKEKSDEQCSIRSNELEVLHKTAKGFFSALKIMDKSYYVDNLIFQDSMGKNIKLSDFKGKTLLVNLWAIWCIPCQNEMAALAELKKKWKKSDFDVIAINVGFRSSEKIRSFLQEVHAANLAVYRDTSMQAFQALKRKRFGIGLPITLVVNPESCVVASFNGTAPWTDQNGIAFIEAVINTDRRH